MTTTAHLTAEALAAMPTAELMAAIAHERRFLDDALAIRGPIVGRRFADAQGGTLRLLLAEKARRMAARTAAARAAGA